jgi:heme/copper-type cytochrome/quinol oxidase subunit 4
MAVSRAESKPDPRRYVVLFVAQLVLTGVAVLAGSLNIGPRSAAALVMVVAALNGTVVLFDLMRLGRSGRIVVLLFAALVLFVVNLLFWPAWGQYDRVRFH